MTPGHALNMLQVPGGKGADKGRDDFRLNQTNDMRQELRTIVFALILLRATGPIGLAQGTFVNLNFEAANLSPVPPGQSGGYVSSLDAIPGWTGLIGTNQVTQVLHNDLTLGNASIDVIGPYWSGGGIIEGQYTVVLQPGVNPGGGGYTSASISQTGLVPADARSLQFRAGVFSPISVSLGGRSLSLAALGTGPYYTLYGADISWFAGQTGALVITALAGPNTTDSFDSFVFSSMPVPEPGALGLSALGALLLGWRLLGKPR